MLPKAAINPFLCISISLALKLCGPVEVLNIETDRVETDDRLVLWRSQRHCRNSTKPAVPFSLPLRSRSYSVQSI